MNNMNKRTFLRDVYKRQGYHWTNPVTLFPIYRVPDGYTKPGRTDKAKDLDAIMHQRVGFYVSKSGRLIAMGNYGVAPVSYTHLTDRVARGIYRTIYR